jgi:hypothetical protein
MRPIGMAEVLSSRREHIRAAGAMSSSEAATLAQEAPTTLSSILFRPGDDPASGADLPAPTPAFATDLHLADVATAWGVDPAHAFARLGHADAVAFRHEVFRDLESTQLRQALTAFVATMCAVDEHLGHAAAIAHALARQRWQLEAAETYSTAVVAAADALAQASPTSRGLVAARDRLRAYVASDAFTTLVADARRTLDDLDRVTYRLRIGEHRVVVLRHDDEPDYGAEVLATFDRFRRPDAPPPAPVAVDVFRTVDMNRVEIGILERVARREAPAFEALDSFAQQHGAFLDPAVAAFADELHFYLAWLDVIGPLRDAGLPFCYPDVASTDGGGPAATGLFDLALALRRAGTGDPIVTNDVTLAPDERILVVTGPNQGGKTAFARAIGQLHHLAAIGVPVPGTSARVPLGDTVHTLFARAEDPADLTGRLEAELTRAADILETLQPGDLVVMNESFASTTVDDALALDRALLREMTSRGATCVVVTFLGELATDGPSTVSMTCVLDPDDPTRPTFRFERRPPDPLAHARAVADVHGLGYDAVRARFTGGRGGATTSEAPT